MQRPVPPPVDTTTLVDLLLAALLPEVLADTQATLQVVSHGVSEAIAAWETQTTDALMCQIEPITRLTTAIQEVIDEQPPLKHAAPAMSAVEVGQPGSGLCRVQ